MNSDVKFSSLSMFSRRESNATSFSELTSAPAFKDLTSFSVTIGICIVLSNCSSSLKSYVCLFVFFGWLVAWLGIFLLLLVRKDFGKEDDSNWITSRTPNATFFEKEEAILDLSEFKQRRDFERKEEEEEEENGTSNCSVSQTTSQNLDHHLICVLLWCKLHLNHSLEELMINWHLGNLKSDRNLQSHQPSNFLWRLALKDSIMSLMIASKYFPHIYSDLCRNKLLWRRRKQNKTKQNKTKMKRKEKKNQSKITQVGW